MATTKAKRVAGYSEIDHSVPCYYKAQGRHEGPIDTWYLWIPGGRHGYMANLAAHDVVEHTDGTISVTPSILVTSYDVVDGKHVATSAHGYLTAGEWRDC